MAIRSPTSARGSIASSAKRSSGVQGQPTTLGVTVDESKWPDMVTHCSFDYMKAHATPSVPLGGAFWDGGAQTFINKGVNGRWRDTLSAEESAAYRQRAVAELGESCARWLETGAPG